MNTARRASEFVNDPAPPQDGRGPIEDDVLHEFILRAAVSQMSQPPPQVQPMLQQPPADYKLGGGSNFGRLISTVAGALNPEYLAQQEDEKRRTQEAQSKVTGFNIEQINKANATNASNAASQRTDTGAMMRELLRITKPAEQKFTQVDFVQKLYESGRLTSAYKNDPMILSVLQNQPFNLSPESIAAVMQENDKREQSDLMKSQAQTENLQSQAYSRNALTGPRISNLVARTENTQQDTLTEEQRTIQESVRAQAMQMFYPRQMAANLQRTMLGNEETWTKLQHFLDIRESLAKQEELIVQKLERGVEQTAVETELMRARTDAVREGIEDMRRKWTFKEKELLLQGIELIDESELLSRIPELSSRIMQELGIAAEPADTYAELFAALRENWDTFRMAQRGRLAIGGGGASGLSEAQRQAYLRMLEDFNGKIGQLQFGLEQRGWFGLTQESEVMYENDIIDRATAVQALEDLTMVKAMIQARLGIPFDETTAKWAAQVEAQIGAASDPTKALGTVSVQFDKMIEGGLISEQDAGAAARILGPENLDAFRNIYQEVLGADQSAGTGEAKADSTGKQR